MSCKARKYSFEVEERTKSIHFLRSKDFLVLNENPGKTDKPRKLPQQIPQAFNWFSIYMNHLGSFWGKTYPPHARSHYHPSNEQKDWTLNPPPSPLTGWMPHEMNVNWNIFRLPRVNLTFLDHSNPEKKLDQS